MIQPEEQSKRRTKDQKTATHRAAHGRQRETVDTNFS